MRTPMIEETACKLACCKTPYVCRTAYGCDHHAADYEAALSRRDQPTIRYASVEVQAA